MLRRRPRRACAAARQPEAALAKIKPTLQKFVDDHEIAGAVTLVACDDKFAETIAVGDANIEEHRPMTPDTLFAIASMTKPITATALMILWDEGKISLDDPVTKFIPEFKDTALKSGRPRRAITLRDLLTHTSGMQGEQRNEGTLAETVVKMAKRNLAFEPGEKWQYSPGISVCGRVIEVVSGQPYEEFLATRDFPAAVHMSNTTFLPTDDQKKHLAQLYDHPKDSPELKPAKHLLTEISARTHAEPVGRPVLHRGRPIAVLPHDSQSRRAGGAADRVVRGGGRNDPRANRRPENRLYLGQGLGTRLVHRARAAGRDRDAFAGHVRSWRRLWHAGLDRSAARSYLCAVDPAIWAAQ